MPGKVLPAQKSALGHSFLNAMWIAGFLAALQIVIIATAVIKRPSPPAQPAAVSPTTIQQVSNEIDLDMSPTPSIQAEELVPQTFDLDDEDISTSLVRTLPAPDLSGLSDPVGVISDSLISILVDSGINDRKRRDYKGALDAFHDANSNLPRHPRILSELAGTYAEMGKVKLAEKHWTEVSSMGPIAGGPFHEIAKKALLGQDPSIPQIENGKFLKIGKITVKKQPLASDGEWVSVRIPIFGKPGVKLLGNQMDLRAPFFDLVNGKTIAATTAKISYELLTAPYNWEDNQVEEVEVIYHQSPFTVEQKQKLGERNYFGYVIELYYQNQLQDTVVSEDELGALRFPTPKPKAEEPTPINGPDASLFPINR